VLIDVEGIDAGDNFARAIEDGVANCGTVVASSSAPGRHPPRGPRTLRDVRAAWARFDDSRNARSTSAVAVAGAVAACAH
jgi:hypothetical protein